MLREHERQAVRSLQARRALTPTEMRKIRRQAGVGVSELARTIGVARSSIHGWEAGLTRPSYIAVTRYLQALDLLKGDDDARPS
jgi:DNA-binding transcriptional regulator YiaG